MMMDEGQKRAIDKEAFQAWLERPAVEKALTLTDEGAPRLGMEERNKFLGHPRDRVIKAFTRTQLEHRDVRGEVRSALEAALRDPRASAVYIDGDVGNDTAQALQSLALANGLPARITDSPDYRGDVGLIVASDEALDIEDIYI